MKRTKKKKSPVAAFCSALGTVLLTVLILACIPLTLPKAFGFQIYTVISGSMEPAIPTGSLVYVRHEEPDTIVKDDVIAFYSNNADGSIITHRVVSNSPAMGQFITKGDALQQLHWKSKAFCSGCRRYRTGSHRYIRQDCCRIHHRSCCDS